MGLVERLAAKWDAIAHLPKWDDADVARFWLDAIADELGAEADRALETTRGPLAGVDYDAGVRASACWLREEAGKE